MLLIPLLTLNINSNLANSLVKNLVRTSHCSFALEGLALSLLAASHSTGSSQLKVLPCSPEEQASELPAPMGVSASVILCKTMKSSQL